MRRIVDIFRRLKKTIFTTSSPTTVSPTTLIPTTLTPTTTTPTTESPIEEVNVGRERPKVISNECERKIDDLKEELMKFLNVIKLFKREDKIVKDSKAESVMSNTIAISRHKRLISNLVEELTQLTRELMLVEAEFETSRTEKEKKSGLIIRRLTLIEYEVGIREEIIKWLS